MVSEARPYVAVLEDHDYLENIRITRDEVSARIQLAKAEGDEKRESYLHGVYRGITMALETYGICLSLSKVVKQRSDLENITDGMRYSIGGDNKLKPSDSDPTDPYS